MINYSVGRITHHRTPYTFCLTRILSGQRYQVISGEVDLIPKTIWSRE